MLGFNHIKSLLSSQFGNIKKLEITNNLLANRGLKQFSKLQLHNLERLTLRSIDTTQDSLKLVVKFGFPCLSSLCFAN
jgi:hypothetical protein